MAQLYVIRHAQASFGSDNYDKLSELGHKQSVLLGQYWAQRKLSFDALITGDMRRHKQTAKGIVDEIKVGTTICDNSWNEFDFDAIMIAYLSLFPEQKPAPESPRKEWYRVLKKAMLAWAKNELTDLQTESWEAFCYRVQQGMQNILSSGHKNVALVSSGGAMAVMLKTVLNTSVEQSIAFNLQIKNTSINHFFFGANGYQLSSFNNVPHLDDPAHFEKITYS